ncbi:hypothetical protein B0H15DRAFT_952764 [Mycena belliarum]|uniref:Uncharacterized protein n=1 Tax=Mycena belliarum TaxID=1033014 RepID=A0AAD6TYL7_9AGAR|nr:hypothetical protein B0H15DRAFT_952764 [Mycena belliae]
MPSIHNYVLHAYSQFLTDSANPLFNAKPGLSYTWDIDGDLSAHAVKIGLVPREVATSKVSFAVFGVVRSLEDGRAVWIGRPAWHREGATGSLLTVRYEQQIMALNNALEARQMQGFFDNDEIVLSTDHTDGLGIGTVVFVRAHLSLERAHDDHAREEDYCLQVQSIEALRAIA